MNYVGKLALRRLPGIWDPDLIALEDFGIDTAASFVARVKNSGVSSLAGETGVPTDHLRDYVETAQQMLARQRIKRKAFAVCVTLLLAVVWGSVVSFQQLGPIDEGQSEYEDLLTKSQACFSESVDADACAGYATDIETFLDPEDAAPPETGAKPSLLLLQAALLNAAGIQRISADNWQSQGLVEAQELNEHVEDKYPAYEAMAAYNQAAAFVQQAAALRKLNQQDNQALINKIAAIESSARSQNNAAISAENYAFGLEDKVLALEARMADSQASNELAAIRETLNQYLTEMSEIQAEMSEIQAEMGESRAIAEVNAGVLSSSYEALIQNSTALAENKTALYQTDPLTGNSEVLSGHSAILSRIDEYLKNASGTSSVDPGQCPLSDKKAFEEALSESCIPSGRLQASIETVLLVELVDGARRVAFVEGDSDVDRYTACKQSGLKQALQDVAFANEEYPFTCKIRFRRISRYGS